MTQLYADGLYDDLNNKKSAYRGMCAVTLLLFLFGLFSYAASLFTERVLYGSGYLHFQGALVSFISFFGAEWHEAYIAAKSLMHSGAFWEFLNMIFTLLGMVLPSAIFARVSNLNSEKCFPVKGCCVKGFIGVYGAFQLFVMFAGSFSTGLYDFFFPKSVVNPGGFTDFSGFEFDIYSLVIRIISVCIFVPIIEEYIFRGVIFRYLRRFGTMYAVFASAAIFGIAHSNPSQSVYALTFGIFSGFLVVVTGNIKTSILFHALNNITSTLNEQITAYFSDEAATTLVAAMNVLTIFFGFAGLYIIAKKGGLAEKFTNICKKENRERKLLPGMKEIAVIPFVVYGIMYALDVIEAAVL